MVVQPITIQLPRVLRRPLRAFIQANKPTVHSDIEGHKVSPPKGGAIDITGSQASDPRTIRPALRYSVKGIQRVGGKRTSRKTPMWPTNANPEGRWRAFSNVEIHETEQPDTFKVHDWTQSRQSGPDAKRGEAALVFNTRTGECTVNYPEIRNGESDNALTLVRNFLHGLGFSVPRVEKLQKNNS